MAFLLAVLWPRCFCMWKKCSCRISTCNTWSGVTGTRRTVHLEVWCWVRHPKRLLSNISLLCFDNMLGFLSSWVDSWVELLIKWIEAGSTTKWWGPWCKALYWCSLSHPIQHKVCQMVMIDSWKRVGFWHYPGPLLHQSKPQRSKISALNLGPCPGAGLEGAYGVKKVDFSHFPPFLVHYGQGPRFRAEILLLWGLYWCTKNPG